MRVWGGEHRTYLESVVRESLKGIVVLVWELASERDEEVGDKSAKAAIQK